MKSLLHLTAISLLLSASPVLASVTAEAGFVECLAEKDPAAIQAINDAPSQKAFIAEVESALETCPSDSEQFSMGRLFTALNQYEPKDSEATQ